MPRKRMIHPELWSDGKVVSLTTPEFVTFIGFVSHADDEGLIECSVSVHYWRICRGDLQMEQVGAAIEKLTSIGMIIKHPSDDGLCVLPNWFKYQTLNRPTQTKHKRLPSHKLPRLYLDGWEKTFKEEYPTTHEQLSEDSVRTHGGLSPRLDKISIEEVSLGESSSEEIRKEKNKPIKNKAIGFKEFTFGEYEENKDGMIPWSICGEDVIREVDRINKVLASKLTWENFFSLDNAQYPQASSRAIAMKLVWLVKSNKFPEGPFKACLGDLVTRVTAENLTPLDSPMAYFVDGIKKSCPAGSDYKELCKMAYLPEEAV